MGRKTKEELSMIVEELSKTKNEQRKSENKQRKTEEKLGKTEEKLRKTEEKLRSTVKKLKNCNDKLRKAEEEKKPMKTKEEENPNRKYHISKNRVDPSILIDETDGTYNPCFQDPICRKKRQLILDATNRRINKTKLSKRKQKHVSNHKHKAK